MLRDHWAAHGYVVPLFQLRELRDVRHVAVRFYSTEGRLLDSNQDDAPPHPQSPVWFTAFVRLASNPVPSEARGVTFNGAALGQLVMAPDPTYEIEEIWSTSRALLSLLLLFFVLVNVVVWWAVSRALRPIGQILQALEALRAGNLAARLPRFDLPELSRIGVGFNDMAATLEASVNENQRLTRELLNAQENERRHLARDLHDEIGQCVSAIHADAVAICNRGGDAVRESAEAIVQVAAQIKESVRNILRRIRPSHPAGLALEDGLREQVAAFRLRNPGIVCEVNIAGDLSMLAQEARLTVYRVVQESLTNITVHANAYNVLIEVRAAQDKVELRVVDDGAGFFQLSASRGLGLTGIRERVRALGGSCSIASEPGHGTCIRAVLPCNAPEQQGDG